jgi:hypothetical protein
MQVYRIYNKINKKSYIGITKWDFETRYNGGKWYLWTHSHHLKLSVEKYGLENFDYEILWQGQVEESELINLEKIYINQYGSLIPNGYNLTNGGSRTNPNSSAIKEYELIDSNGNIFFVKNLSEFCRKNKLNYSAMLNMVSGISISSQGFALSSSSVKDIRIDDSKEYFLENIKTKEITSLKKKDVCAWAKERGLNPKPIQSVIRGKNKISQNWKLLSTKLEALQKKYENVELIDSNGNHIIVNNIYEFCKKNGFERGRFYALIKESSISAYGYILFKNK